MRCPFCSSEETPVKDSRPTEDGASIRRRRSCQACGSRFTTFERIQLRELTVIKRSGEREIFNRDKLARSIFTALRKRPIEATKADSIISSIVRKFESTGENEISSKSIGEMVIESLIALDPVAYIRFASVYHDFQNIQDFKEFLCSMENKQGDSLALKEM